MKKPIKMHLNLYAIYAIKTIYVKHTEHGIERNEVIYFEQFDTPLYHNHVLNSNVVKQPNSLVEYNSGAKTAVMNFFERRYLKIEMFFDCYLLDNLVTHWFSKINRLICL